MAEQSKSKGTSEAKSSDSASKSAPKAQQSTAEKAREKVGAEMAEVMPLSHPVETELDYREREPDKVVPEADSDGAETPSGHALRKVGKPDLSDPLSEKERVRGLRYRLEKFRQRWLA